jgi:alginate O-acetyltransferase complex protein AlgI
VVRYEIDVPRRRAAIDAAGCRQARVSGPFECSTVFHFAARIAGRAGGAVRVAEPEPEPGSVGRLALGWLEGTGITARRSRPSRGKPLLFNSQIFLLVFLPLTLAGFYLLAARRSARLWLLIVASFVFYGYWDVRLLPLLGGSIAVNWALARLLRDWPHGWIAGLGVTANLVLLGVFKYADFVADTVAALGGPLHEPWGIVLPLGISFFTFQQISYLVERSRGDAPDYGFRDYCLYIAFFPQLIAGPIVRHNELIHQFAADPRRPGIAERVGRGLAFLLIGLAKKVFVADALAEQVDTVFAAATGGSAVTGSDAWLGGLGFSLQIYFDFSAYSDMAIGIALMLGFVLPANFNAPYRATSIRDFWRRWHITLSRFLRDYLYIPMGGSRHGALRQIGALMATMLLGGLWHGAGWTFVLWGGLHGGALALNHLWQRTGIRLPAPAGWAVTFLFVIAAFVVFRAESLAAAQAVLAGMAFANGVGALPDGKALWLLAVALAIVLLCPTTQRLALEKLTPRPAFAVVGAVVGLLVLLYVGTGQNAEFIYFQF